MHQREGSTIDDGLSPLSPQEGTGGRRDGDMSDLLQELRVLLQGVQVLVGFLIVLPFSEGFERVTPGSRRVYLVLFLCAILSLLLFSAPAAQHRILTPLRDRVQFKKGSTRLVVVGMVPLSAAMVLATHFVLDAVGGRSVANIASGGVAVIVAILWWIAPLLRRRSTGV
jgi:hypothetical protein